MSRISKNSDAGPPKLKMLYIQYHQQCKKKPEWEQIFAQYMSEGGLVSRVCKMFLKHQKISTTKSQFN